jgi:hypothetical protein
VCPGSVAEDPPPSPKLHSRETIEPSGSSLRSGEGAGEVTASEVELGRRRLIFRLRLAVGRAEGDETVDLRSDVQCEARYSPVSGALSKTVMCHRYQPR